VYLPVVKEIVLKCGVVTVVGDDVFEWASKYSWRGQKQFNLGFFNDEQSAAQAYDEKAKVLFGAFAKLNFPIEQEK
jgi:hypothetical protein